MGALRPRCIGAQRSALDCYQIPVVRLKKIDMTCAGAETGGLCPRWLAQVDRPPPVATGLCAVVAVVFRIGMVRITADDTVTVQDLQQIPFAGWLVSNLIERAMLSVNPSRLPGSRPSLRLATSQGSRHGSYPGIRGDRKPGRRRGRERKLAQWGNLRPFAVRFSYEHSGRLFAGRGRVSLHLSSHEGDRLRLSKARIVSEGAGPILSRASPCCLCKSFSHAFADVLDFLHAWRCRRVIRRCLF